MAVVSAVECVQFAGYRIFPDYHIELRQLVALMKLQDHIIDQVCVSTADGFPTKLIVPGVSIKVPFSPSMSQGLNLIKYW